jgi:chromosome segregation protein
MGGVRLVTLQGDLIEATGAMTGGFVDIGDRGKGADTAVELKRLGDELQAKSVEESDVRAELTHVADELRTIVEELARRTAEVQASGSTAKLIETQLAQARDHLATARRRVLELGKALESASARQAAGTRHQTELEAKRTELDVALAQINEQFHSMLPQATSRRIRALQEGQEKATAELMEVAKELEGLRAQVQAAQTALGLQRQEVEQSLLKTKELTKQIHDSERAKESAAEQLDKLRQVETEAMKAVQGQSDERKRFEADRLKVSEQLAQFSTTLATRQTMDQSEAIRLAMAQKKLGELEEAAKAFPEEAEEGAVPAVPLEELRKKISVLGAQLEAMGSVNLRALEEYDEEKARLDGFETEVGRLSTEKEQLLGLVGEIETKKKQKLIAVVDAVNIGYREIYSELSAGGEGEISLENPEDPLSAGLRISARPIGKNVQRLEQLSGGEKSLASLAFVFALQRFDPSPLYVFDEVDMSLDGVNAENVGRLLRRNAERAQFVVISLRKVTLKFAHRLFGVTMHGDGRSRVVSLGLEEIVDVDDRDRDRAGNVPAPVAQRAPEAAA